VYEELQVEIQNLINQQAGTTNFSLNLFIFYLNISVHYIKKVKVGMA